MHLFFFFRFWVASLDCLYERIFFKLLKILHPVTYHDLYELVWVSSEREKSFNRFQRYELIICRVFERLFRNDEVLDKMEAKI